MVGESIGDVGVLPAYAGMIRSSQPAHHASPGAPRVCGDDPIVFAVKAHEMKCSPRMRG